MMVPAIRQQYTPMSRKSVVIGRGRIHGFTFSDFKTDSRAAFSYDGFDGFGSGTGGSVL